MGLVDEGALVWIQLDYVDEETNASHWRITVSLVADLPDLHEGVPPVAWQTGRFRHGMGV